MNNTSHDIILHTTDLAVGYISGKHTTTVLSNVNLTLRRGKVVALLGHNGAGKSTLLRTITGLQPPLSGSVEIFGKQITDFSKKLFSTTAAIVTTDRISAGALTVEELVALGRQPYTGIFGRLSSHDKEITHEAIESVGIAHKAHSMAADLSDGERQKAMIAKALAQTTPIIILDEPTAFLDAKSSVEALQILHHLAHQHDKAILLSSHDVAQAIAIADELWVILHDGSLISGNTEDLVLGGHLERMFDSQCCEFNSISGNFEPKFGTTTDVALTCNDAVVSRYITSALLKNGFRTVAPDSNAPHRIIAHNDRTYLVNDRPAASMAELLQILSSQA